jgi:molybdenum-dependent DNA-binding transcriptional regulator ModE
MDLQVYYKKIRDIIDKFEELFAVIVSLESPEGGKAGVKTEVPKQIAAKMIVEGQARLATPDEAREFLAQKAEAKRRADQAAAASRVQFTVIPQPEPRNAKTPKSGD